MFNMQNRSNQINALFMSEQVNFLFLAKVLKKVTNTYGQEEEFYYSLLGILYGSVQ